MPTIERILSSIAFKGIVKKKVLDLKNFNNSIAIDKIASSILINDKNVIMGEILGEGSDCSYCPMQGHGCYISTLEYAENVPDFDVVALLKDFTSACNYATDYNSEDNSIIYRYDYIWFTIEDNNVTTSVLLRHYSNHAKEVYSDGKIHVYAVPVRNGVIKTMQDC